MGMHRTLSIIVGFLLLAATTVVAQSSAQPEKSKQVSKCPVIIVECPKDLIEPLLFRANVSGENQEALTFEWVVHGGTLIDGQGTRVVKVKGDPSLTVGATLRLDGLPPTCPSTASCSFVICKTPPAILFDTYRWTANELQPTVRRARPSKRRRNLPIKHTEPDKP